MCSGYNGYRGDLVVLLRTLLVKEVLLTTDYWLLLTLPTTVKEVAETAARHRNAK